MKITIIGSGHVSYHLAKAFTERDIKISQIFGRNEKALHDISEELKIPYSTEFLEKSNLYIIAVKDDSISEVSTLITDENSLVAHTSGSTNKNALIGNYHKASFYPLQTFSKEKKLDYSKIPFFIDADNKDDKEILKNLALKISKNVMLVDDEKRRYIHLTAVFACNFVNHLWARAKEIADSQDIPFEYFLPLIEETMDKIHHLPPKQAQTGPAVRNDEKILKLHRELLTDKEQVKIYETINQSIKKMYEL